MGRRAGRRSALCAALLLAGACAPDRPAADGPPPNPGRLVIVGGALKNDNAEVYRAILDGRRGDGPLCVVPTASADAPASMASAMATFATYVDSAQVEGVLIATDDPSRARDPEVADRIRGCSGFFFTGGVQTRVLDTFLPGGDTTVAFRALWDRWQEGAVISGSSAGAAMMSGVMIASGASADAVVHGVVAEEDGEGVNIRSGMGFFRRAILDQHFLARGRVGRLLVAVLATDSLPVGLGIDENTALVVDGDSARVAGFSGVLVVDGRTAEKRGPFRGAGIEVTLAGTGDVIDLRTFTVRHAEGKAALPRLDGAADLPDDPFARWAFLHLLEELSRTDVADASFAVGDARLRVAEGDGFSAVMRDAEGGADGAPAGLSAGPFEVELSAGN